MKNESKNNKNLNFTKKKFYEEPSPTILVSLYHKKTCVNCNKSVLSLKAQRVKS